MIKIAIIEDNLSNMKLLKKILERAGYETVTAEDGQEGITLVRTEMPDLVLMDIHMPGVDGITATKKLKNDIITRHIPVIAVTAKVMDDDVEDILNAGCDAYTSKPFRFKKVLDLIESTLKV